MPFGVKGDAQVALKQRLISFCAVVVMALSAVTATVAAEPGNDKDVLCWVNGEPIKLQDLDLALFWDEYALVKKDVLDFLIQEVVVRQEMARKGISVKDSEIDEFLADLDRTIKSADKTASLAAHLASQGMDMAFFRRKTESAIGLCRLTGARGRPYEETQKPAVRARMNELVNSLAAAAKVETAPDKLEAGVAATVGGERIMIEEAGRVARMVFGPDIRDKHLGYLQALAIIRQEMRRKRLELTPADMDYQIKLLCAKRASELGEKNVSLGDVLRALGRDPQTLRKQADFQARAMLSRLVASEIADEDVRRAFSADPAKFGDGVPKASHIMLKTVDERGRPFSAEADRKVRARLEGLRAKLVAGEDFAAAAARFSEDKDSADRAGALGFLDKARIADPVVAAAYGLKVGEISQPVRGTAGWHLVKVLEIRHVSFDDVKDDVRVQLIAERSARLLGELKKKAEIKPGPARP